MHKDPWKYSNHCNPVLGRDSTEGRSSVSTIRRGASGGKRPVTHGGYGGDLGLGGDEL
jgi:hypothetical protein